MAGLCDRRVAIVTDGGRGIGWEYCLMLAAEGARVVVNDLGAAADGAGADAAPAQQLVAEIAAGGGQAVANWHRGPTVKPVADPKVLGPIVADLVARARRNAGMDGQDLDGTPGRNAQLGLY